MIRKNGTDTIIVKNTDNIQFLENSISKDFKLFTTIDNRAIK